jgi:hypothetical protein
MGSRQEDIGVELELVGWPTSLHDQFPCYE